MRKLFHGLVTLIYFINCSVIISGQTIDPVEKSLTTIISPNNNSSIESHLTIVIDWINDPPSDSPNQIKWDQIIKLLTSQLIFTLMVNVCQRFNNGFITIPLAIGFIGLMTALIALIVACQANWKVAKYEFKSAERRRREREIEEVHLKIYEQVIYGDKYELNCSGHSMEKLIHN